MPHRSNDLAERAEPTQRLAARHCVGIVASAGGIEALSRVLAANFPASMAIVLHIPRDRTSLLAEVLGRVTPLQVRQAQGGEVLTAGTVLVAPPDRHLVVSASGTAELSDAPLDHHSRPSGNPLFASLARHYGPCAVAVVLTGYDGDGAEGLKLVKAAGGATLAQDEASSAQFSMPQAAIATGDVDQVLPIDEMAPRSAGSSLPLRRGKRRSSAKTVAPSAMTAFRKSCRKTEN